MDSIPEYRAKKLIKGINEKKIDGLIVTDMSNIRYLTGFTGSSGALLVNGKGDGIFFTDFRYIEQANQEVTGYDVAKWQHDIFDYINDGVKGLKIKVLGVESRNITLSYYSRLKKSTDAKIKATKGLVEKIRIIKDSYEVELIQQAVSITESSFDFIKKMLCKKLNEKQLAFYIEQHMRDSGADSVAFDLIVAAGKNSSKPHAGVSEYVPRKGDFVIIDIGARYKGYCADLTRTFVLGSSTDKQKEVYNAVKEASETVLSGKLNNVKAVKADGIARKILEDRHGDFGHGLGHGVGLEVHEAPSVSPNSKDTLKNGMVFTVEPALYIEGEFGVRIENMVHIQDNKAHVLSKFTKELVEIPV